MTFGEKLQDLRRKAGISQDTLAEKLDVSRQAVSKWERDEAMPETEKVVRIARLFGTSLDELLLDRDAPEPKPEPEPIPQPAYRPNYSRQIRRHGYKIGYIPMAIGAMICAFSLIMCLVWPAIGRSFTGGMSDFMSDVSITNNPLGAGEIIIEGDWELSPGEEQAILDAIGGEFADTDFLWSSTAGKMDSMVSSALKAQASLFLIGLLPGGALLATGILIVVKGKKYARQAPEYA